MKLPHEMRRGNRYAREAGLGRTLGELASAKMAPVAGCAGAASTAAFFFTANLITRYGENFPALALRERLRCSTCCGRMANLHESSR